MVETELGVRASSCRGIPNIAGNRQKPGGKRGNSSSEAEETSSVDAGFRVPASETEENSFLSSNIT